MKLALEILAIWFAISIPFGLFLGRVLHVLSKEPPEATPDLDARLRGFGVAVDAVDDVQFDWPPASPVQVQRHINPFKDQT